MAIDRAKLGQLVEPMRAKIEQYTTLVQELAGDRAEGLTLFGAIAEGTFDVARHTVRNVLVLGRMDLDLLRRLAHHGVRLGKLRIAAPLVMTPDHIHASCDTFPLELLEIQQHRVTLFGRDYFERLDFDPSHVRLQCERELKTALIGMRQGLLAAAGSEKVIGALEVEIGEGLLRTLRGLLWLKGDRDAKPSVDVVDAVEKMIERPLRGVQASRKVTAPHGWAEFEALYQDVEALGERVDAW